MSKIHELPDIERVEREASDWIVRLHAEDVTAADRAGFAAWRQAHVRHERAYEELAGTWQEFRKAGHIVRAVDSGLFPRAYGAALMFWGYPILLILAVGTWRSHRRLRHAGFA